MPLDKSTFSKTKYQSTRWMATIKCVNLPCSTQYNPFNLFISFWFLSHHSHTCPFSFIYHSSISLFSSFFSLFFLFYLSRRIQMQVKWLYEMLDSGSREISHARWQLMRHHSQHVPLVYQCKLSVCISIYLCGAQDNIFFSFNTLYTHILLLLNRCRCLSFSTGLGDVLNGLFPFILSLLVFPPALQLKALFSQYYDDSINWQTKQINIQLGKQKRKRYHKHWIRYDDKVDETAGRDGESARARGREREREGVYEMGRNRSRNES